MITLTNIAGLKLSAARTRLLGDGLWVTLGQVASAVGTLVGLRLCTELIPPAVFGTVGLLVGLSTLGFNLLCAPLLSALLRFFPEAAGARQLPALRRAIRRPLFRNTALLMAVVLVGGAGYCCLPGVRMSFWSFVALAGLLAIDSSRTIETNLLTAARRQRPFAVWNVVEAWARPAGAVVLVLALGATPSAILWGYLLATAASLAVFLTCVKREGLPAPDEKVEAAPELTRGIWSYVLPLMPLALVGWVSTLSDRYIIGGLIGLDQVGIYAAAYGLVSRPFLMAGSIITNTLRPLYYEMVSAGDHIRKQRVLRYWLWLASGLFMSGFLGVILCRDWIASLVLAKQYHSSADILPLLALGHVFYCLSTIYNTVSLAHKNSRAVLFSELAGALGSLALGVPLTWAFGLRGAAAAVPFYFLGQLAVARWLARSSTSLHTEANPPSRHTPPPAAPDVLAVPFLAASKPGATEAAGVLTVRTKAMAKRIILGGMWFLLGRERLVRLARFLTNESRLDGRNEMSANGEATIQSVILNRARGGGPVVVFDVGANVGLWTRSLAEENRQQASLQVHAFEPCPGTRQTLAANLRAWGLEQQVRLNACALSSASGEASFYSLGDNMGRNSLHPLEDGTIQHVERVTAETLDRYCAAAGITHIDLVKIDTEGHDLEVIQGAKDLLQAGRIKALQFEYNHRWVVARHFLRDAFEFLTPLGYRLGKITPYGVEFYPGWDMELESFREANFLAVKHDMVSEFPQLRWWKEAA